VKVYVATRFVMWRDALGAHAVLETYGHEPTSRWVYVARELNGECAAVPLDDPRRHDEAVTDVVDVCRSDALVLLTPEEGGTGCWFEVGLAIGQGIPVFAVGARDLARRRTIFAELPDVVCCDTIHHAVAAMQERFA